MPGGEEDQTVLPRPRGREGPYGTEGCSGKQGRRGDEQMGGGAETQTEGDSVFGFILQEGRQQRRGGGLRDDAPIPAGAGGQQGGPSPGWTKTTPNAIGQGKYQTCLDYH